MRLQNKSTINLWVSIIFALRVVITLTLRRVNPQPWRFTNNNLGLPHVHSLFVGLFPWICVVCVCFLLYLSVYLCCARCVFCALFYISTPFFFLFLLYKFNRHLCHGAYWCTHSLSHMPTLLFLLHFNLRISCVCVCQLVYALSSSCTWIYNHRHIHMYIYDDYCAMTTYNMNIPNTISLCVPTHKGFARSLHTRDPMSKGLYFDIHTSLCFLWIHTYHVHRFFLTSVCTYRSHMCVLKHHLEYMKSWYFQYI